MSRTIRLAVGALAVVGLAAHGEVINYIGPTVTSAIAAVLLLGGVLSARSAERRGSEQR